METEHVINKNILMHQICVNNDNALSAKVMVNTVRVEVGNKKGYEGGRGRRGCRGNCD